MTDVGHALDGHQNIGLGKIGCRAASRKVVGRDHEAGSHPILTRKMTGEIDQLAMHQVTFQNCKMWRRPATAGILALPQLARKSRPKKSARSVSSLDATPSIGLNDLVFPNQKSDF